MVARVQASSFVYTPSLRVSRAFSTTDLRISFSAPGDKSGSPRGCTMLETGTILLDPTI